MVVLFKFYSGLDPANEFGSKMPGTRAWFSHSYAIILI